jgi:hypothetical protein
LRGRIQTRRARGESQDGESHKFNRLRVMATHPRRGLSYHRRHC